MNRTPLDTLTLAVLLGVCLIAVAVLAGLGVDVPGVLEASTAVLAGAVAGVARGPSTFPPDRGGAP